jgi:ABC-type lipoprotein export system ATPase subunit
MLTKIQIRNIKKFENATIELASPVVFIGPNNSGKTTALQALALWQIGLRKWLEKRGQQSKAKKRPGITLNRREAITVPIPSTNLLWRNKHLRNSYRNENDKPITENVRIEILVSGVDEGAEWYFGLEFDYANEDSFHVRPLIDPDGDGRERMAVPDAATRVAVAFLPPMSGLSSVEPRLDKGAINVRLGEGRTAEVLRNLCFLVATEPDEWSYLSDTVFKLFGVRLNRPEYISERGEITMTYTENNKVELDISAAGRGLQQTVLLLAHMASNPRSVLLVDEPDAHLEILRQRQAYQLISEASTRFNLQVIIASHSEVILNEAADRDVVIAFVGPPHRIDDRSGSQVMKALKEIGFDQFYQAEQTGWVLYLEGSTDLAILYEFALRLDHPAKECLEKPFVHYVANSRKAAEKHFYGLREAKRDLIGVALFDNKPDETFDEHQNLKMMMWRKREIENYLCTPKTLENWVRSLSEEVGPGPIFTTDWSRKMNETIDRITEAMSTLGQGSPWDSNTKVTDNFLDRLFEIFFQKISLPNLMRKSDYHRLVRHLPVDEIDPEIFEKLNKIKVTADLARPFGQENE